jgi:hypothetical protein
MGQGCSGNFRNSSAVVNAPGNVVATQPAAGPHVAAAKKVRAWKQLHAARIDELIDKISSEEQQTLLVSACTSTVVVVSYLL